MKIKILALFILVVAAYGCGNSGANGEGGDDGRIAVTVPVYDLGEIGLAPNTRAPMTGWYDTEVHMAYGESDNGFAGFSRALNATVSDGITVFSPLLFYPVNGDEIYLRGFYPREGITNLTGPGRPMTDDKINYTITGQEDIMVSNVVSGSQDITLEDKNAMLTYVHLLTQLSFTIRNNSSTYFPSHLKVMEINVCNVSRNAVLNLDPAVGEDDPDILVFTDTPTPDSKIRAMYDENGLDIPSTATPESHYVMFRPGEEFFVEVVLNTGDAFKLTSIKNTLTGEDITLAGGTRKGYRYRVDLVFGMNYLAPTLLYNWTSSVNLNSENDPEHIW